MPDLPAEDLGRLVREAWVAWASKQPDPKPSWLTGWDDLDAGQREADMLIGQAVTAAERERITRLAEQHNAWCTHIDGDPDNYHVTYRRRFADLIRQDKL
jgi:hypothetical protein